MHSNHKDMVRMKSNKDGDYITISENLQLMCEDAPQVITNRWEEYDNQHREFFPCFFLTDCYA